MFIVQLKLRPITSNLNLIKKEINQRVYLLIQLTENEPEFLLNLPELDKTVG